MMKIFHLINLQIWFDQNSDIETFKKEISEEFQYITRDHDFGEIVPKGCSKATGIEFLLDYFNLELEDARNTIYFSR